MSAGEERALVFIENKTISTMKAILFAIVLALLPLGAYGQGSEEPMSYIYACGVKAYDNWDYASAYQYFMRELEVVLITGSSIATLLTFSTISEKMSWLWIAPTRH